MSYSTFLGMGFGAFMGLKFLANYVHVESAITGVAFMGAAAGGKVFYETFLGGLHLSSFSGTWSEVESDAGFLVEEV